MKNAKESTTFQSVFHGIVSLIWSRCPAYSVFFHRDPPRTVVTAISRVTVAKSHVSSHNGHLPLEVYIAEPDVSVLEYSANLARSPVQTGGRMRLGAVRPGRREGEWGEGPSLAITAMFFSEFTNVFRLSVSIRWVASEYPFCVLMYMNS